MKRLLASLLFVLAPGLYAEEYQCTQQAGCIARITLDGELQTHTMRKGDIVSTEAGWVVSPDDGWERVRTNTQVHCGGVSTQLPFVGASAPVPMIFSGRPFLRQRPQGAFREWMSAVMTRPVPNDYTLIR